MKIFLSGAIEGVESLATGWRIQATEQLSRAGHEVVSPIVNPNRQVFIEPNEIVRRNMLLQKQCDLLLVEYTIPNRCYVGTDFEMVKALDWNQPVIVFAHEMYRERVYLRYLASALVPDLEAAIDYIVAYYPA